MEQEKSKNQNHQSTASESTKPENTDQKLCKTATKRRKSQELLKSSNVSTSQMPAHAVVQVGPSSEKQFKKTTSSESFASSRSNTSIPEHQTSAKGRNEYFISGTKLQFSDEPFQTSNDLSSRASNPSVQDDLQTCRTWLYAVAEMEGNRKSLVASGSVSASDHGSVETVAKDLYTKIQELFSTQPSLRTRISIFSSLFLFLPEPLTPNISSRYAPCDIPLIFSFINDVCSSPSPARANDIISMDKCIRFGNLSEEEKLRMIVLVIPCVMLSNFFAIRENSFVNTTEEISTANRQIKKTYNRNMERCFSLLKLYAPSTLSSKKADFAHQLVHFHYKVAHFNPSAFEMIRRSMQVFEKAVEIAPYSETEKKVAKLVMILFVSLYEPDFERPFLQAPFWIFYISQFYNIKTELDISKDSPLTFEMVRVICQNQHS